MEEIEGNEESWLQMAEQSEIAMGDQMKGGRWMEQMAKQKENAMEENEGNGQRW